MSTTQAFHHNTAVNHELDRAAHLSAPLLRNQRFVLYSVAKLLQQAAQNALLYGLFIIVIREQDSAIATSAFVIAMTAPSLLLSIPGAVIAESMPRKFALLLALTIRAVIAWTFIGGAPSKIRLSGVPR